jgi:DNA polymerase elongation subunit (family B)
MSQFKNNPNFNLYYSDTDSIYIDRPLDESIISSTILGKLKLENSVFTDSCFFFVFFFDKALPDEMVNSKTLSKMKLENVLTKAIFLAPKLYCLVTIDGKVIHKVKGLNHNIDLTINDFEQLLCKDSFLQKPQTK